MSGVPAIRFVRSRAIGREVELTFRVTEGGGEVDATVYAEPRQYRPVVRFPHGLDERGMSLGEATDEALR